MLKLYKIYLVNEEHNKQIIIIKPKKILRNVIYIELKKKKLTATHTRIIILLKKYIQLNVLHQKHNIKYINLVYRFYYQ